MSVICSECGVPLGHHVICSRFGGPDRVKQAAAIATPLVHDRPKLRLRITTELALVQPWLSLLALCGWYAGVVDKEGCGL